MKPAHSDSKRPGKEDARDSTVGTRGERKHAGSDRTRAVARGYRFHVKLCSLCVATRPRTPPPWWWAGSRSMLHEWAHRVQRPAGAQHGGSHGAIERSLRYAGSCLRSSDTGPGNRARRRTENSPNQYTSARWACGDELQSNVCTRRPGTDTCLLLGVPVLVELMSSAPRATWPSAGGNGVKTAGGGWVLRKG